MSDASLQPLFEQALAHHHAGRLRQAEIIYRQILVQLPRHSDALHHLGVIAHQVGNNQVGLELVNRAIAINSRVPEYYNTLGEIHRLLKSPELAEQAYRKAIELSPHAALFHSNLSVALRLRRRFSEAIDAARKAVELDSQLSRAHLNLANALSDSNQFTEAISHYQQAAARNPTDATTFTSLGTTFSEMGRFSEALDCFNRAIALNDSPDAHLNRAFVHLLHGDFARGWEDFEYRWQSTDLPSPRLATDKPRWDGSHVPGKTILLVSEQGAGDAIQFIRYAPMVAERSGAKIAVVCRPELKDLFEHVSGISHVHQMIGLLPDFDFHVPLLSLPRLFQTDLRNIPAAIPYLSVDRRRTLEWKARLPQTSGRRVGIVWQGRTTQGNDRNRSMSLQTLAPLRAVPNVQWISLQKGPGEQQIAHAPVEMRLLDFSEDIHDFSDTAAIIENLDLVIGVDTAVVHLAGALGKSVWTMLCFSSDWRYLRDRSDSPWYPTMRLFRQSTIGDWNAVVNQVAQALRQTE